MNEGKNKPEQKPIKLIVTPEDFSERINDMKNQIMPFVLGLQYGLSIERLKEDKTKCINFEENLKQFNEALSPEMQNSELCQKFISFYNGLIERIKTFETKEDLEQIIKEYKEGVLK